MPFTKIIGPIKYRTKWKFEKFEMSMKKKDLGFLCNQRKNLQTSNQEKIVKTCIKQCLKHITGKNI